MGLQDMGLAEGDNLTIDWAEDLIKEIMEEMRRNFADYVKTEGCSCCQDVDGHKKAEKNLAKILKPDAYEDGSGFDWHKYAKP